MPSSTMKPTCHAVHSHGADDSAAASVPVSVMTPGNTSACGITVTHDQVYAHDKAHSRGSPPARYCEISTTAVMPSKTRTVARNAGRNAGEAPSRISRKGHIATTARGMAPATRKGIRPVRTCGGASAARSLLAAVVIAAFSTAEPPIKPSP